MKGFGNNDKTKKKSKDKKANSLQKDKLISNALLLHSKGNIKEALEIYNFLIQNKIYDPRILNNLGSIYSQIKQKFLLAGIQVTLEFQKENCLKKSI